MSRKGKKARSESERVYLGPQISDKLTNDSDIYEAMAAQLGKYRSNPMSEREIAEGQDRVREAFGVAPQRTPSTVAAAEKAEPPFLTLCRAFIDKAARGTRAHKRLQREAMRLDATLGDTSLFTEWEKHMAPVQHMTEVLSKNPMAPATQNRQNILVLSLAASPASHSTGKLVRAIEDHVGVSCLGALIVPRAGHVFAIFDYHDTRQYATCVLFKVDDKVLLAEHAETPKIIGAVDAMDVAGPVRPDFFTLTPTYFQDASGDPLAMKKQQQNPSLMRWAHAAAAYVNYVYFDRIKQPYADLIDYDE